MPTRTPSVYHRLAAANLIARIKHAAFLDGLTIGAFAVSLLALLWWII